MRVKPASPGLVICDPDTRRRLPDEGAEVNETQFWVRRLLGGDVVLIDDPASGPSADHVVQVQQESGD